MDPAYDEQVHDGYTAVDGHVNMLCCTVSLQFYSIADNVSSAPEDAEDNPPAHDAGIDYGIHAVSLSI